MADAVAAQVADMACTASNGRDHPVFGLWPLALAPELRRAMVEEGLRKVDLWAARYKLVSVDFPAPLAFPCQPSGRTSKAMLMRVCAPSNGTVR